MNSLIITCLLSLNFMIAPGGKYHPKQDTSQVNLIRDRCRSLLLSDTAYATERSFRLTDDVQYDKGADGYFKSITAEGKWMDINYQSQERSAWKPSWHLYRLMLLLRAYYKVHDPNYLEAVHRGMAFWIRNDFKCENWWHNNINVPFAYSSLILMLGKDVKKSELDYLNKIVVTRIPVYKATGQNLIWQLDNEARVALIHEDYSSLLAIVKRMEGVINISSGEGIQPDFSFHQHGPMLQFGNYGIHFVNSLLFWMMVTTGTDAQFDRAKEKIVFDYCSKGLRWTIYSKAMDIPAIGRQLRSNSGKKRGANLYDDFNLIQKYDSSNYCNYVMDGFSNNKQGANCILKGNRSFWRSDYMVQLFLGKYMMSVKTHGKDVHRIESINSENLKGAFLNDGLALVQRTGKEHLNIAPLWNWTMLPGITCDTTINPGEKQAMTSANRLDFVGQISDGDEGFSAMDYQRAGIAGRKSYFMTDGMMIALGAGIKAKQPEHLVTTAEQRLFMPNQKLEQGRNKKGQKWVWSDSIAYYFPENKTDLRVKLTKRTGNWNGIQKAENKMIAGSILTIFIEHYRNNHYAYIIQPGIGKKEMVKHSSNLNNVKILRNDTAQQAIVVGNKLMAVCYQSGKLKIGSTSIAVDQPCLLLIKNPDSSKRSIWVSDPTRKLKEVKVRINDKAKNIAFKGGDLAGSASVITGFN